MDKRQWHIILLNPEKKSQKMYKTEITINKCKNIYIIFIFYTYRAKPLLD